MASWADYLSPTDHAAMCTELHQLVVKVNTGTGTIEEVQSALAAWQATAEALADPETRAVLLRPLEPGDLVPVPPPAGAA